MNVTVPVEPTDRMIMATYALGENASAAQIYAAMLSAAPPTADAQGGDARGTWIIVNRPGLVPVRKGPCIDKSHTETMLRELYALHPDCMLTVITMPNDCYPDSGIEWLDIYGDKRKTRVTQAHPQAVPGE